MKSEKLQFDRSLATDSEATYRLRTKSHHSLDAGIGGTFYSIPVDSYRNFRRILLYAAMRTISSLADLLSVHLIRFTSERTVNFRYSGTARLYDCTTAVQYYSTTVLELQLYY